MWGYDLCRTLYIKIMPKKLFKIFFSHKVYSNINTGIFPDELINVNILTVFKKGEKLFPRTIAFFLPAFARNFEKVLKIG